jgi:hypothetical protein
VNEYLESSLSTWLRQGAVLAALVASLGLAASRGRLAVLMERKSTMSSRLWELGAVADGAMIVVASFLPAYGFEGDMFGFWEWSLGIYDVLYVVAGLAVIGVALAAAALRGLSLPSLAVVVSCRELERARLAPAADNAQHPRASLIDIAHRCGGYHDLERQSFVGSCFQRLKESYVWTREISTTSERIPRTLPATSTVNKRDARKARETWEHGGR